MDSEDSKKCESLETGQVAQNIDKSRRAFARVGAATPVILTLSSKPVFGAVECASAMLSTTHTSHSPLNECWGGLSPGFWLTPHGTVSLSNDTWKLAWRKAIGNARGVAVSYADAYGTRITSTSGNQWNQYHGGATYSVTPFTSFLGTTPIREVLGNNQGDTVGGWHYIAAWLNLQYAAAMGWHYVLNQKDFFTAVNNGTLPSIVQGLYDQ